MSDSSFHENLIGNLPALHEIDRMFRDDKDPAWFRFSQGVYSFPLTLWVGIIQFTMLTGAWGVEYKASAQFRQQALSRTLYQLWKHPERKRIISRVAVYARDNFKAYLAGRMLGGVFTSYAQVGGKRLPLALAIPQGVTNLTIASYGAAIMAIAKGITSFEEVILGVITGKVARHPEFLRDSYGAFRDGAVSAQEIATIEQQLQAVEGLNNYNPAPPIRIDAFCSKPENSYLRQTSLCSN